ncbi:MAG: hypothetical protein IT329_10065, partial [Caldilineaceae bacterium]|nr:hypothetical protein [Caldilineaceae bacterium]
CPVVYFATDGSQTFGETELRAKVHQKHPDEDDVWICYCFWQSAGMIRKELNQTGISTAVDAIQAGIRAGQCACDIRNPQGNCCLGNVRATVKRLILSANPSV